MRVPPDRLLNLEKITINNIKFRPLHVIFVNNILITCYITFVINKYITNPALLLDHELKEPFL